MKKLVRKPMLTLGLLLGILALPAQALTVKFSEAELQAKILKEMPIVETTPFMTVKLTEPVLTLAEDKNEIQLQLNINLLIGGAESQGYTRLTGSLSYKPEHAAFYVTNMQVHEVKVAGMPDFFTPEVAKMAEQVVNPMLDKMPIYRLKDDATQTMLKAVLESIEVRNKELIATLSVI